MIVFYRQEYDEDDQPDAGKTKKPVPMLIGTGFFTFCL